MFYEQKHSSNKNFIRINQGLSKNFNFPLHLHENYEFIYVEEGIMRVGINGCDFDVKSGEGALILPNQPHEFSTPEYSVSWIAIFSADHIPELKNSIPSKTLLFPVIKPKDKELYRALREAVQNPLRLRSILYELAALYSEGKPEPRLLMSEGALVCRIVEYIDAHYKEQMTLEQMARDLGYSYRYMSGVVNRFFKLSLPKVVNRYRINCACGMLEDTDDGVTEIALRCGFGSIRNFNRSFKELTGLSPQEYRIKSVKKSD